jgi:hypothetical protein
MALDASTDTDTARESSASPDPRAAMASYAAALAAGDARLAADLFAESSLLVTPAVRLCGRQAIAGWHHDLLDGGILTVDLDGQGDDQGRLDVQTLAGPLVVEIALDASGRIGIARWLTGEQAGRCQEERTPAAT